ncbi:hypothetical protein LTR37_010167 [Vermiconidia calcicola]|uniref:Uncharacterized protein n=1 Tax=Vermiconidia calcicola TaxID=1690605 RepID=A0ACC3N652_9PEZI|nr:hypothetical protein LTR37_010167 [Vermiconidia calcicola]
MAAAKTASYSNNIDFATGYVSGVSYDYRLTNASRGSAPSTKARSNKTKSSRVDLRNIDTSMSSTTTTTTVPSGTSNRKLHKRGSSGSSLPGAPSPVSGAHSKFTTPYATFEEPFPDISATAPSSSTPKIKPYLRKLSSARDDSNQGRLDLNKSTSEIEALSGLGIQEFGSRSVSDVNFSHTGRRTPHMRTTSVGSQVSNGSGSFKPAQPFVHPMRQTPNAPYTPTGQSYASSLNEDEARESSDIVTDDDLRLSQNFRNRSMSISSTPQPQPTPLSQSHTAADLGYVPKLTSPSQTNLSIRSAKSSKSRLGRPRRDTDRSESFFAPSQSSRTSLDKPFSFVSRRSDPDPATRDERIRAARRKFEEKEANKDRKEAMKRREVDQDRREQRRRGESDSATLDQRKIPRAGRGGSESRTGRRDSEKLGGSVRPSTQPGHITALPGHRTEHRLSGKQTRTQEIKSAAPLSGWERFIRLISCGVKR